MRRRRVTDVWYLVMSMLSLYLVSFSLSSCTTDSYETGEGTYSRMTADFAELRSDGQKKGVSFINDDGTSFILTKTITASWIKTADSTYRTSIYYNKVGEGMAEPIACSQVTTIRPKQKSELKKLPQDPLAIESCWLSRQSKYLNLALLLKNGRNSEGKETTHIIGVVLDETRQNTDGTTTACYRLLHDRNGAPEYYTNRTYVSILLPTTNRPDSLQLEAKTNNGSFVRTMKL